MTFALDHKPLVILEIANNHMGKLLHGKLLVETLAKTIAPFTDYFEFAVKFQFRDLDTFIHPIHRGSDLKFVKRFEETKLTEKEWGQLISISRQLNFGVIATPFDEKSVSKCAEHGLDFIKIASCSLCDWPLIETIARTKKKVIFSTAGANIASIDAMVSFFSNRNISAALMHCVGLYPTPNDKLNISQISFFKQRYPHLQIGFSTHEDPKKTDTGAIGVALGAEIFEKHVGLETDNFKNNLYSATPKQLERWLGQTTQAIISLGCSRKKIQNTKQEISALKDLQRGAFVRRKIKKGEVINCKDVFFAIPSSPDGIVANDFSKYTTITAAENLKRHQGLTNANTSVKNYRLRVQEIVDKLRDFLKQRNIMYPSGKHLELSHHYGLENFDKTGLAMVTVINMEYCKKLLFVLPGQSHPEQYHKEKNETFVILHGALELMLDGKKHVLTAGDSMTIQKGIRHSFFSSVGCVIEELSTNHKPKDSYYTDPDVAKNKNRKTIVNFWQ